MTFNTTKIYNSTHTHTSPDPHVER